MPSTPGSRWLKALAHGLADLIWPPLGQCALCGVPDPSSSDPLPVCAGCLARMAFPVGTCRCRVCQRPLGVVGRTAASRGQAGPHGAPALCVECDTPNRPFASLTALGLYQEPVRTAVLQLKFKGKAALAEPLGRHLAAGLCRSAAMPASVTGPALAAVIPVPLHPARQRERGFNQAERLAKPIAAVLGVPVQSRWLVRNRSTATQSVLDRPARLQNLVGAFQARLPGQIAKVVPLPGPVLLVDDVFTTGATIWAAASALRQAGIGPVHVAVLAVSDLPVPPALSPQRLS